MGLKGQIEIEDMTKQYKSMRLQNDEIKKFDRTNKIEFRLRFDGNTKKYWSWMIMDKYLISYCSGALAREGGEKEFM